MAYTGFDALPKEILALIASSADALSILRLAAASKTVRAACFDALVFRNVILRSQQSLWDDSSLDLDAIGAVSGKDASLWARYALADQKAYELSFKGDPFGESTQYLAWLPELLVVKHPFLHHECWSQIEGPHRRAGTIQWSTKQVFLLIMATLASRKGPMQKFEHSLFEEFAGQVNDNFTGSTTLLDVTLRDSYRELCSTALRLRQLLQTRKAVWPFNDDAIIPFISIPDALTIPMQPVNARYTIPLPFAGTWNQWQSQPCIEMAESRSYLENTEWVGYYLYSGHRAGQTHRLDPPMQNIRFTCSPISENGMPSTRLEARDCQDGIAAFEIEGCLYRQPDGACKFSAVKRYAMSANQRRIEWQWKLRLTPFGFIGYYGKVIRRRRHNGSSGGFEAKGTVWLWKKEWTA